ncbi:MAG TPA: hypothetical protein V6D08_14935 [Candidatus Obscuribacterales bacterium]
MSSRLSKESFVRLEHLDTHLKAILKLRIREFVHLSPWFRDIPSIDTSHYQRASEPEVRTATVPAGDCPNRAHRVQARRRYVRPAVI